MVCPSADGMITGLPASITLAALFDVPKSIPIIFGILLFPFFSEGRLFCSLPERLFPYRNFGGNNYFIIERKARLDFFHNFSWFLPFHFFNCFMMRGVKLFSYCLNLYDPELLHGFFQLLDGDCEAHEPILVLLIG